MFIIILGAPGSGKGTVSKILSKMFKIQHLSTGDIFREAIAEKKTIGKKIEKYMKNGLLVPDEIVNKVIENKIKDNKKGLILDGYPRTIKQAKFLEDLLAKQDKKVDKILRLEIDDDEIIYRTEKRRICSNKECGEIYNLEFKKPKVENKCDKCGGSLVQREDDKKKVIKDRLRTYHKNSKPIIKYYEQLGIVSNIELSLNKNITKQDLEKVFI